MESLLSPFSGSSRQESYLGRLDKALKRRTRAPMSNAKSISIGPLVVADTPKMITTLSSSTPNKALTNKSGSGRFVYQRICFFILSFSGGEVLIFCSIQHAVEIVNSTPSKH